MTEDEILAEFRAADALLEGHFILSSGLHSPRYLQCARVLMDPMRAARLASALAASLPREIRSAIEIVVSPAMGGLIIGHEMGRALGVEAIFVERPTGTFELRRGFRARGRGRRCCWWRTSSPPAFSSREAIKAVEEAGGEVIAAAALVDRSSGTADLGVPFFPLIQSSVPDLRGRRAAARARRDAGREAGEPEGRVSAAPAPRRQYRPCRDDPQRARRRSSRSGARGVRRRRGRRRRHHRASARGPAPYPRRRYRPADRDS